MKRSRDSTNVISKGIDHLYAIKTIEEVNLVDRFTSLHDRPEIRKTIFVAYCIVSVFSI